MVSRQDHISTRAPGLSIENLTNMSFKGGREYQPKRKQISAMVLAKALRHQSGGRCKALRRQSVGGIVVGERAVCPAQAALARTQRDSENLG